MTARAEARGTGTGVHPWRLWSGEALPAERVGRGWCGRASAGEPQAADVPDEPFVPLPVVLPVPEPEALVDDVDDVDAAVVDPESAELEPAAADESVPDELAPDSAACAGRPALDAAVDFERESVR